MYERELRRVLELVEIIRPIILEIYDSDFAVEIKDDKSPVTLADQLVDKKIREYLSAFYPNHAFLTEESEDDEKRLSNDFVWIIDPIDGTKNFVAKDGQFTVNIALAYKHEIVLGVIFAPIDNITYFATKGSGAYKVRNGLVSEIHVNNKLEDLTVITSKFHLKQSELDVIEKHKDKITKRLTIGASLKPCLIAEGKAEISYRFSSGTKEWDIAPAVIIVEEAGGLFVKPDGTRYTFNRKDVRNLEGYIIANRQENILL